MKASAKNRRYLENLGALLEQVPQVAAIEIATRIFAGVVLNTAIDSGQAALNWHLQPYTDNPYADMQIQQMLWGYGDVAPIAPAGYKWSGGINEQAVRSQLIEEGIMQRVALRGQHFTGIVVYNPIDSNFPGFTPGSDMYYPQNAFQAVDEAGIVSTAIREGELATAAQFSFVRVG